MMRTLKIDYSVLDTKIKSLIARDSRSIRAKKNMLGSILIKGAGIFISILLVPVTLDYLSPFEYGVWLTLSSIFTWINYLDIGLSNGLRNKLAETFVENNQILGKVYVSTTFFLLSFIMAGCCLVFFILQPFLNWAVILNVDTHLIKNLNAVLLIAFAFFSLSVVFKIAGIILIADQRPAMNDLITLAGSAVSLLIIFILSKTTAGSLAYVLVVFTSIPSLVLMLSFPFVLKKYRFLKPSFTSIKVRYAKDLMGLGIQFFILQISSIIVFSSTNIIISQILSPELVTPYNIAFKYFSFVTLLFNIIITPMWTATTEAFRKGEMEWIKNALKEMMMVWLLCVAGIFIMTLLSDNVYSIWIGQKIKIPFLLTVIMAVYTIIIIWSVCFSTFLFGIGKLKLQIINLVLATVVYIPLAIWLGKTLGIFGIVLALCLVNLSGAVLNPIQLNLIFKGKAKGVWYA
jgi:O-antigen/teichoic acid export membrane protein